MYMYYNKKTKARFSRLLRHLAWKQSRPILVLTLHKFHLLTYLLTAADPHGACHHLIHAYLGPSKVSNPKRHLDWFSHFCTAHGKWYTSQQLPLSPSNLPLHIGDLNPILYMVPWAHLSPEPKRHLDSFSCFCRAQYCGRPDRPCYSICNNRLLLCT